MAANEILTLALAIWGAVLSTILALREFSKEKRRIRIFVERVKSKDEYQIRIVNVGHRPVTITGMGLGYTKFMLRIIPCTVYINPEKWLSSKKMFPKTLDDSENMLLKINEKISQKFIYNKLPIYVSVFDSEGSEYFRYQHKLYDPETGYIITKFQDLNNSSSFMMGILDVFKIPTIIGTILYRNETDEEQRQDNSNPDHTG